jgi:hypothetical protein
MQILPESHASSSGAEEEPGSVISIGAEPHPVSRLARDAPRLMIEITGPADPAAAPVAVPRGVR